ncbi:hypothetical protein TFUB4_02462 [Tannerella forsythia]|nr:hypothetical protein TFUB4_02462 [Tannerella forsythia]
MPGTRYPSAEGHPPQPPFKGRKERSERGMSSFQRGNAVQSAVSIQRSVLGLGPRAVSRRSSEQGERKSGCPSEASYLIFRPASVATACEAHEALTFWLLLGQAKSDKKEIHRFALNDKLMVNG